MLGQRPSHRLHRLRFRIQPFQPGHALEQAAFVRVLAPGGRDLIPRPGRRMFNAIHAEFGRLLPVRRSEVTDDRQLQCMRLVDRHLEQLRRHRAVNLDEIDPDTFLVTNLGPNVLRVPHRLKWLRIKRRGVDDAAGGENARPDDFAFGDASPQNDRRLGRRAGIAHRRDAVSEQQLEKTLRRAAVELRQDVPLLVPRVQEQVRVHLDKARQNKLARRIDHFRFNGNVGRIQPRDFPVANLDRAIFLQREIFSDKSAGVAQNQNLCLGRRA